MRRLKNKKIVLVDMDQILANLVKKWLHHYNHEHDDTLTVDDIKTWEVGVHSKLGKDKMEQLYLLRPGFFDDLEPLAGGLDGMRQLHDMGLHVQILTSAFGSDSARAKIEWILRHVPWMDRKSMGIQHYKQLVYGDFFIDDSVRNLSEWKEHWMDRGIGDNVHAMSIAYPWHEAPGFAAEFKDVKTFPSYRDTEQAWGLMVQYIKDTLA